MEKVPRPLRRKKNDWILIAFILSKTGPISLNELSFQFSNWRMRDSSSRRLATIMSSHKSKGFTRVEELYVGHDYIPVYAFEGEIPHIDKYTAKNWEEKLSL